MAIDPTKLIDVGTTANDGTGDPLRTAFQKANTLFTELWDDDEGDVNQVTGTGGITASPTTGDVVVNLDDDSITYDKLGTEFTTAQAVSATTLNFDQAQVFTKTLAGGTTTFTVSGADVGMVKDLILTGTGSFLITGGKLIAGNFVESATNFVQIVAQTSSSFWYSISQEQA